jgi:hypothetical protein
MEAYKNEIEEVLDDLGLLNRLYNKEYIEIGEFMKIRDRMLNKITNLTKKEYSNQEQEASESI